MDATGEYLCNLARRMWHGYLLEGSSSVEELLPLLDESCVVIGTGKHEFYEHLADFKKALEFDLSESEDIDLEIVDEWYEHLCISESAYLVYGGIHVRERADENEALVDMDTRFSLVFRHDDRDGAWHIVHIHHSLPYFEQKAGEFYPRTLSQKACEAIELANRMRELARHDQMTGTLNHAAFFEDAENAVATQPEGWWCFVADVDDFKGINDGWGHLEGDKALKALASALLSQAGPEDIVGRIGGDEFAVMARMDSVSAAEAFVRKVDERFALGADGSAGFSPSISVGFARVDGVFRDAVAQADAAMYAAKRSKLKGAPEGEDLA